MSSQSGKIEGRTYLCAGALRVAALSPSTVVKHFGEPGLLELKIRWICPTNPAAQLENGRRTCYGRGRYCFCWGIPQTGSFQTGSFQTGSFQTGSPRQVVSIITSRLPPASCASAVRDFLASDSETPAPLATSATCSKKWPCSEGAGASEQCTWIERNYTIQVTRPGACLHREEDPHQHPPPAIDYQSRSSPITTTVVAALSSVRFCGGVVCCGPQSLTVTRPPAASTEDMMASLGRAGSDMKRE